MTLTENPPTPTRPKEPTPRKSSLPQIVGGGVLVLIGLLWLLERYGTIDISVTAVLALGTMLVGIALMLLAREGAHVGLIVFGTILAAVTLVTAAAPLEGFQGGVGDRTIVVSSVDDIQADYNLAMGTLVIDLRQIDDLEATTRLSASVGTGELVVRVPDDVDVAVDAQVGAGQFEVFGRVADGIGLDESFLSPGLRPGDPRLSLDLSVFTGRVEVTNE
ncbi:MAG: LiaF domain-containing protein [Acidimicrobiia bacterium]